MTTKAAKRAATDARILAEWTNTEEEFEDKSTPFVISMVADRTGVDYGRVVDALSREAERNGQIKSGA